MIGLFVVNKASNAHRDGINVNVTLLFSVERYERVAEAYFAGLEQRAHAHEPVDHIASVASFFLSRIDQKVDPLLDARRETEAKSLRGRTTEACAKIAYQGYRCLTETPRWRALAEKGARRQRVLWASMSTKDPNYSDVKYVDALIGPETIATLPLKTLTAYRDHGNPARRLEHDFDAAQILLARLAALGINLDEVTAELEIEGVDKFVKPFDALHRTFAQRA